jgi:hypothetical protein
MTDEEMHLLNVSISSGEPRGQCPACLTPLYMSELTIDRRRIDGQLDVGKLMAICKRGHRFSLRSVAADEAESAERARLKTALEDVRRRL